jgi:hypothetical protein
MRTLAIYYIDPVEGRQKFEIRSPTDLEVEHYLWVAEHIRAVPDGHSIGLFGANMVLPTKTLRRDWLLNRDGVRTIRIEELTTPSKLWSAA